MDPGSPAALIEDPRGALEQLQATVDVRFEHLAMDAEHTAREVDAKKAALADAELSAEMSIIVFGSGQGTS